MVQRTVTRVGFTGHQRLAKRTTELVRSAIRLEVVDAAPLIGYSSLAAGSDQIFAECVLSAGGELGVVIPSRDYERAFSDGDTLDSYRRLLTVASVVIELEYEEPSEAAFLAAGRRVVVDTDRLLAVWDGQPAAGIGGTADIVDFARSLKRPTTVIWPHGATRG